MKAVLDIMRGGYSEGFDRNRVYRFSRDDGTNGFVGRIADTSPYFNLAGLYYSELPDSIRPPA
jgi:hypothetical protein